MCSSLKYEIGLKSALLFAYNLHDGYLFILSQRSASIYVQPRMMMVSVCVCVCMYACAHSSPCFECLFLIYGRLASSLTTLKQCFDEHKDLFEQVRERERDGDRVRKLHKNEEKTVKMKSRMRCVGWRRLAQFYSAHLRVTEWQLKKNGLSRRKWEIKMYNVRAHAIAISLVQTPCIQCPVKTPSGTCHFCL